jgi:hypothetical protein
MNMQWRISMKLKYLAVKVAVDVVVFVLVVKMVERMAVVVVVNLGCVVINRQGSRR